MVVVPGGVAFDWIKGVRRGEGRLELMRGVRTQDVAPAVMAQ